MAEAVSTTDCIFCQIVTGSTQSEIVYDGEDTLFFRDISPKAAVHIVGVPKEHIASLAATTTAQHVLLGKLVHDASLVAAQVGLAESGYRVITNVGSDAGQEVPHLHFHILGGEPLGPLKCS